MAPDENSGSPDDLEDAVDEAAVASRAGGRPPEEASSEDPDAQARAILEESEQRIVEGSRASEAGG
jgi:hypothetical protein